MATTTKTKVKLSQEQLVRRDWIAPAIPVTANELLLKEIESFLGDPSRNVAQQGGTGTSPTAGFDCSGLIYDALLQLGVANPPRTSEAQWGWVTKIQKSALKPGDLIFSQWPGDSTSPGHVQIYLGAGKVIQSPGTSTGTVSITTLASDAGHIVGYGRMPPAVQHLITTNAPSGSAGVLAEYLNKGTPYAGDYYVQVPKGVANAPSLSGVYSLNDTLGNSNWSSALWATLALAFANLYRAKGTKAIPITANNVTNMQRWIAAEYGVAGKWGAKNNPLNMTGYGAKSGGYPNLFYAAQVFGHFVNQSNMSGIRNVLTLNAPTKIFSAAVVKSPWATGHYGGNPLDIANTDPNTSLATGQSLPAYEKLGTGGAVPDSLPNPLSDIASDFSGLGSLLGDLTSATFWKRIGIFVLGGAVFGIGLAIFISTTKPGQDGSRAVSEAAVAAAVA